MAWVGRSQRKRWMACTAKDGRFSSAEIRPETISNVTILWYAAGFLPSRKRPPTIDSSCEQPVDFRYGLLRILPNFAIKLRNRKLRVILQPREDREISHFCKSRSYDIFPLHKLYTKSVVCLHKTSALNEQLRENCIASSAGSRATTRSPRLFRRRIEISGVTDECLIKQKPSRLGDEREPPSSSTVAF